MQPHPTLQDIETSTDFLKFGLFTIIGILFFLVAMAFYRADKSTKR